MKKNSQQKSLRRGASASPKTRIGKRRLIFGNKYQKLYSVPLALGSHRKVMFVTDYGVRVGMLALRDGKVLLVRQYRMMLDDLSWEIPGGATDRGEPPARAAVRECGEETGVHCLKAKLLITFHPGLDTLINPTHIFYSLHTGKNDAHPEDKDTVDVRWVPLKSCLKMVADGRIVDSLSIIALLAYASK